MHQLQSLKAHLQDTVFYVVFYLNRHRLATTLVVAAALWLSAYVSYFKGMVIGIFTRGQPHSWRIDQVNKTAYRQGRRQVK